MLVLAACTGGRAHRPIPKPTGPAGLPSPEVVYTVDENHGEGGTSTTTVIDVADPYVARIVNRNATGMLGGSTWGSTGLLVLAADGGARQVQQTPPGFTGGDTHLDVALPLAASLG